MIVPVASTMWVLRRPFRPVTERIQPVAVSTPQVSVSIAAPYDVRAAKAARPRAAGSVFGWNCWVRKIVASCHVSTMATPGSRGGRPGRPGTATVALDLAQHVEEAAADQDEQGPHHGDLGRVEAERLADGRRGGGDSR